MRPEIQATPVARWAIDLRDRVVGLLEGVARAGQGIGRGRLEQFARLVQDELADGRSGRASRFHLAIVEAVSLGYDPGLVGAAILEEAEERVDPRRGDLRACLWHLHPNPRDFIAARTWSRRHDDEAASLTLETRSTR